MGFKEILMFGIGAIAFVFVLIGLNNFVGQSPLLMMVGFPAIIGIVFLICGSMFTYYVYHNHT